MTELLQVDNIAKHFYRKAGFFRREQVTVLQGISLSVKKGETLALVGESGSGKTTLARCIMGMLKPETGSIAFNGVDVASLSGAAQREHRSKLSMVYQNPYVSLNPHFTLLDLIAEPLRAHRQLSKKARQNRVRSLMQQVGLNEKLMLRKIGALSGGQAQRVAIARALALQPQLMILDEPTSALDVSVQAQILNLLAALQSDSGYSYLLITHNLDVVRHSSDRVVVISKGQIVEHGETLQVLAEPQHAYTRQLIAATPRLKINGSTAK